MRELNLTEIENVHGGSVLIVGVVAVVAMFLAMFK